MNGYVAMPQRVVSHLLLALLLTAGAFQTASAQSAPSARGGGKPAYGVLIDNTGSLRSQFPEVVFISKRIVEHVRGRGPTSIFNFRTEGGGRRPLAVVTPGTEWSQEQSLLERHIDGLYIVPGQTALRDAISSVAERVRAQAGSAGGGAAGDGAVFVITDGEDRVSKTGEGQLLKALKESGVKVYAVGLTKELDGGGGLLQKSKRGKAVEFLEKLTKETGGRVVFTNPQKEVGSLLNELFAQ
jgi:hypothetical protein